jgi:hypothetical protein
MYSFIQIATVGMRLKMQNTEHTPELLWGLC